MIYHVEFDVETGVYATNEQVIEWIQYCIGYKGKISNDNPMYEKNFDPKHGTVKIEQRTE